MSEREFYVSTKETMTRSYLVRAKTKAEAKAKFEAGEYDREFPGESEDCEIVEVFEAL